MFEPLLTDPKWPQLTHTQSENGPSNYGGTRQLEELLEAIRVQHSLAVTIYSNLLANFHQNIGVKNGITAAVPTIFASYARLETLVSDLLISVQNANKSLMVSNASEKSPTPTSTNKP